MRNAIAALLLAPALASAEALVPDRAIVKTVTVKATVDETWKAWTTTEGIKTFFAPDANVEARPGGPFEIFFNPYAKPGLKGADDMVVLAVQEKKMISFTWNSPPYIPEVRGQRTAVVVRIRPAGEGLTEVRLVHSGWGEGGQWDQAYAYFDKAWGSVLDKLGKRFAEGPFDWAPYLKRMKEFQDAEDAKAAAGKKP